MPTPTVGIVGYGAIGRAIERLVSEHARVLPYDTNPKAVPHGAPLEDVVGSSDVIFFCTPSWGFRGAAAEMLARLREKTLVVALTKGLEARTGYTSQEVWADEDGPADQFLVLGGPMLAGEICAGCSGVGVIACAKIAHAERIRELFAGTLLKTELSKDVPSVALAGVLKNVYTVGAGVVTGLGWHDDAKGWVVAQAMEELVRVGIALGAAEDVLRGTAGFGDFLSTALSRFSKNRAAGETIGHGRSVAAHASEGIASLPALLLRLRHAHVSPPPVLGAIRRAVVSPAGARGIFERLLT